MRQKGKQGFASMPKELVREIASKGGKAHDPNTHPGNFKSNRERARTAGAKGGRISRKTKNLLLP